MNIYVYIINVIVCICVIIFCGIKVMLDSSPTTTSIYLPIMSGVVGYFVPQPSLNKKDKNNITSTIPPLTIEQLTTGSQQSGIQSPPLSPTLNIQVPRD